MKGDYTRFTFDPKKHYTGVFKQQGRVDLDADWNEYVEMQEHLREIVNRDAIGLCGVPENESGFEIKLVKSYFREEHFLDEKNGWRLLSGSNITTIQNTKDGGINWQDLASLKMVLRAIHFINEQKGWCVGNEAIITTNDGGASWTDQTPNGLNNTLRGVYFLDEFYGWVVGEKIVLSTKDGGKNWTDKTPKDLQAIAYGVYFSDKNHGWVESSDSKTFITENGGDRWKIIIGSIYRRNPILIYPGRIYVDGILVELGKIITYLKQPDYPHPPIPIDLIDEKPRKDLIYLDVWRRHITAIEDPEIREKALGGPDTATRVKTLAQVKILEDVGDVKCESKEIPGWPPAGSGGRLSAFADPANEAEKPCDMPSSGGYSGLENRLYRVEIHMGGDPGTATFKWSRDNGSVVFPIKEFSTSRQIRLKRLGRDQTLTLHKDDWVEISDDVSELSGSPGTMAKVSAEPDQAQYAITLDRNISGFSRDRHAKVRRWDQKSDAIVVTTGSPIDLEKNGIKIQFSGSNFKTGDYWVFAARTTGEVDELVDAPPKGIKHHYCKLALIKWQEDDNSNITADITDCRIPFKPLTELKNRSSGCCNVTVSVEDNLEQIITGLLSKVSASEEEISICLLPGKHSLPKLDLVGSKDLRPHLCIYGCCKGTVLVLDGPLKIDGLGSFKMKRLNLESHSYNNYININAADEVNIQSCVFRLEGEVLTKAEKNTFEFKDWGRYNGIMPNSHKMFSGYVRYVSSDSESESFLHKRSITKELPQNLYSSILFNTGSDEIHISNSEPLCLGEGYKLAIYSIDPNGDVFTLELTKNGKSVNTGTISPSKDNPTMGDNTYYYKKNVGYSDGLLIIAVHFKNAFRGGDSIQATIDGVWQISESLLGFEEKVANPILEIKKSTRIRIIDNIIHSSIEDEPGLMTLNAVVISAVNADTIIENNLIIGNLCFYGRFHSELLIFEKFLEATKEKSGKPINFKGDGILRLNNNFLYRLVVGDIISTAINAGISSKEFIFKNIYSSSFITNNTFVSEFNQFVTERLIFSSNILDSQTNGPLISKHAIVIGNLGESESIMVLFVKRLESSSNLIILTKHWI